MCLGGAACQPTVALAPFRARPDSVQPGDLRGPFDGQVVDAGTGKPVDGATVVGSWALRTGRGLSGPSRTELATVETDADGRYRLPELPGGVGMREALERFTLVIYKRGYLGWRSDRRFADLSPRTDFAQTQVVTRLERLPGDVSHARHLAFLGAAGPLLAKVEWELPLAAEEVTPGSAAAEAAPVETPAAGAPAEKEPPPSEPSVQPHLDARVLLSAAELKAVSSYPGTFTVEPLPDLPSTSTYDSVHFRAAKAGEKFDAAIRAWKLPGDGAERRFGELSRELPKVTQGKEVGDRSLRSAEGDLLAVAALDRAQGVVILFTCGRGLCSDHAQVAAVLRRMWGRRGKLGPARAVRVEEPPRPVTAPPAATPAAPPAEPQVEAAPEAAPVVKATGKGKRGALRRAVGKKGKAGLGKRGVGKKGKAGFGKAKGKAKGGKKMVRKRKR